MELVKTDVINVISDEEIDKLIDLKIEEIKNNQEIRNKIKIAINIDADVDITGMIFKSKKYDRFSRLLGNRKLDERNVKKLEEDIRVNGYKESQPIIVDGEGNVVDGEHRKKSCENLELPIVFAIEITENSLKTTQGLNLNQTNWKLHDFINSYAQMGFEDYINFKRLIEEEGISESMCIWLIYRTRNATAQQSIKEGRLVCREAEIEEVKRKVDMLKDIQNVIPSNLKEEKEIRNSILSDKVGMALLKIANEKNYSHSRMIKQVREKYRSIDKGNMKSAGRSLVEIYNLKLAKHSGNRLRSYDEID